METTGVVTETTAAPVAAPPAKSMNAGLDVTINSQVLARELKLLDKIVTGKPAMPMLANVLLQTDGDQLNLAATDLEVAMTTSCSSWNQMQGRITIHAKRLLQIVDQLPNADVRLVGDATSLQLTSGNFRTKLQTMSADDFPDLAQVQGTTVTFPAQSFRLMIDRTRFAVSAKGEKRELAGALMVLTEDGKATMVATDGKRLALSTLKVTGAPVSALLPIKTLDVLASLDHQGDLELTSSERHLFFKMGDRVLTSRTIDGKFPAYERVIPRNNDKIVQVGRSAMAAALRRVGLISEESQAVSLNFANDLLTIESRAAQIGEADETVAANYQGDPISVVVNWQYVLDFLEAASSQTIEVNLKDSVSPVLMADGDDYLNVIMVIKG